MNEHIGEAKMTNGQRYHEIRKRLESSEFIAEVLSNSAFLEQDLEIVLSLYFCAPGRHFEFIEYLCGHLSYETKIQIFKMIPARKCLKSKSQALDGLRKIQKIRNVIAHPPLNRFLKISNLCNDHAVSDMILDYPKRYHSVYYAARRGLYHIARAKEWQLSISDKIPHRRDFLLERWRKEFKFLGMHL